MKPGYEHRPHIFFLGKIARHFVYSELTADRAFNRRKTPDKSLQSLKLKTPVNICGICFQFLKFDDIVNKRIDIIGDELFRI